MKLVGCCGPSNAAQSPNVDAERTVNLFPERRDAGDPKSPIWLYATPGLREHVEVGVGPVPGCFAQNGQAFFVSGLGFYELFANGQTILRGSINNTGQPAYICSNGQGGNQLLVVSGGYGYVYNLVTGVFGAITDPDFPQGLVSMCAFLDGYGLVLIKDTPTFQWSALEDFTDWDALDIATKSQTSDNIRTLTVDIDRKVVWLIGEQNTELWYDSGDALQPFVPVPNALVSQGTAAPNGFTLIDDAVVWIGESVNGSRMAMEGTGTAAHRVSSHAVEYAWSQFDTVADCVAWAIEYRGHSWCVFSFPDAESTWVYDRTERTWFEWMYWDTTTGAYNCHLGQCHMYAFDEHFVGSRVDGKLYRLSGDLLSDDYHHIRRLRRFPHIADENEWIYNSKIQYDLQVGTQLEKPERSALPLGSKATFSQRISRNAGRTFGNTRTTSMGEVGDYVKRVIFWRNGRYRDGVIEFTITDNTVVALINAYGDFEQGTN